MRRAGRRIGLISTNEVFDGERTDGRGYTEADPPGPINPYGASKLAGEREASKAYEDQGDRWIVRTAWLYGPPGNDFPNKILAASDRLPPGEPLSVVEDEIGSPTFARDLAEALLNLIDLTDGGQFHLVNNGRASRLDWAARLLGRLRPDRPLKPISRTAFSRPSKPPAWAVLESIAMPDHARLRHWTDATDAYLPELAG